VFTPTKRRATVNVIRFPLNLACADSGPFPWPSPLASSPVEAKCCSLRSSLPRTVVLPSAATIALHRRLSLRPLPTRDAHLRLLGDSAESLPCQAKPIPFLPEALSAINRHLGTPERGPSSHPRNLLSSQTSNAAPLDLRCLSSTSPVNHGLPSGAILMPVEPASEEVKPSRMPLSDWRPSASAAPIATPRRDHFSPRARLPKGHAGAQRVSDRAQCLHACALAPAVVVSRSLVVCRAMRRATVYTGLLPRRC
jgi:hypothetical protein